MNVSWRTSGIATLFPGSNGKFRARILFEGNLKPVEFFWQDVRFEINDRLMMNYPFVKIVPEQEFEHEIEHIAQFNARSGAFPSNNIILSDEDIQNLLVEVDSIVDL